VKALFEKALDFVRERAGVFLGRFASIEKPLVHRVHDDGLRQAVI